MRELNVHLMQYVAVSYYEYQTSGSTHVEEPIYPVSSESLWLRTNAGACARKDPRPMALDMRSSL